MAKRSASKGSRSERRAERERAVRARQHGLPERLSAPRVAPPLVPPGDLGEEPVIAAPAERARRGLPTWAKVLGIAAVILLGVYLLRREREKAEAQTPAAEPVVSAASSASRP